MSRAKTTILLISDSASSRNNRTAKGVLKGCHERGWQMRWRESLFSDADLRGVRAIVASMPGPKIMKIARRIPASLPLISVDGSTLDTNIPTVAPDPRQLGNITAEHLLGQGFINFAFVGNLTHPSIRRRNQAFQRTIATSLPNYTTAEFQVTTGERFWARDSGVGRRFLRFLKGRPLPLGIMASDDHSAVSCLEVLIEAGFHSPQDVAVVGTFNDPVFTTLILPLTSIQIDFERMGELAVELAEKKWPHRKKTDQPPPQYVFGELIERRSSQLRMLGDERISRAVEILQSRHTEKLTLPALAKLCGMSRANFAVKFTKAVGEPPIRYLINYRLDRASYLLAETNLPIHQITERVGFQEQYYFTRAFRKKFGRTPSSYRKLRRKVHSGNV